ncbi:MAG: hypothetical protein KAX65_00075 [Caldilineaceae bacterium]|nr:hypothetical protein [Caldilineaceae bacterium]
MAEKEARIAEREATILKIDLATARAAVDAYRAELDGCLVRWAELERMRSVCVWRSSDDSYTYSPGCDSRWKYGLADRPAGEYCPHCGERRKYEGDNKPAE